MHTHVHRTQASGTCLHTHASVCTHVRTHTEPRCPGHAHTCRTQASASCSHMHIIAHALPATHQGAGCRRVAPPAQSRHGSVLGPTAAHGIGRYQPGPAAAHATPVPVPAVSRPRPAMANINGTPQNPVSAPPTRPQGSPYITGPVKLGGPRGLSSTLQLQVLALSHGHGVTHSPTPCVRPRHPHVPQVCREGKVIPPILGTLVAGH